VAGVLTLALTETRDIPVRLASISLSTLWLQSDPLPASIAIL